MQEKKKGSFNKIRFYFLAAAILIGAPNIFGFYSGQTGRVLVATHKAADDPNFSKGVIYIFYNGFWGAQGVVINEPLSDQIAEKESSEEDREAYYFFKGGPVAFPKFKLVALDVPSKASRWRSQPLTIAEKNDYESYIEQKRENKDPSEEQENKRGPLYFGFASWITGQLESEIRRGVWRVLECENLDFNGVIHSDIWQHLSGDLQTTSCISKN